MIEQSDDYRLDPALHHSCQSDINLYCSQILAKLRPESEYNGKVLQCLKVCAFLFLYIDFELNMRLNVLGKVSAEKTEARM